MMRGVHALRTCLLATALSLQAGCYYAHVAGGQASLWAHRQPIDQVVTNPKTDPAIANRLALALQARRFASDALALPRNGSYTRYVDLHRRYVVWNVFATPPYSVKAIDHCFPIAGCVAYRGYFSQARAAREAARLRRSGLDVSIGGVPAYSTLGWFDDPVLSSMLWWDDDELAGEVFHELAHQRVYLKGDTAFNESYATFVQRQGLEAWRNARGLGPVDPHGDRMEASFTQLVIDFRQSLAAMYARGGDAATLATEKRAAFAGFRESYAQWRDTRFGGDKRYDAWVAKDLNNASLLPFGLYEQWVPAFAALFGQVHGNWAAFHAQVAALAREPAQERRAKLEALATSTCATPCG
jgi:predicted aminopeptidase